MDLTFPGLVVIASGALAMLGAALNWSIVTRSGKLFNRVFGDTIARVIYFAVGVLLFIKGIEMLIGAHWLPF